MPKKKEDSDAETDQAERFSLSGFFNSPTKTKFTVAAALPLAAHIEQVQKLPEDEAKKILSCYNTLYSHVVMRTPAEGTDTYHPHIAGTALYEQHHDVQIKGADHTTKAVHTFKQVQNNFNRNKMLLQARPTSPTEEELAGIRKDVQASLAAHHDALVDTMQTLPDAEKQKYAKEANVKFSKLVPLLSPGKREQIKEIYPPAPAKTPERLSPTDIASQIALREAAGILLPPSIVSTAPAPKKVKKKLSLPAFKSESDVNPPALQNAQSPKKKLKGDPLAALGAALSAPAEFIPISFTPVEPQVDSTPTAPKPILITPFTIGAKKKLQVQTKGNQVFTSPKKLK